MQQSGYAAGTSVAAAASSTAGESGLHARLKRQYLDYLGGKSEEIKEQKTSRAYYHGAQWTDEQVRTLNKRKQPVVTYNRVGRKINAIVGLLERQKQDPRGFPRTPKHEEGAELATAVLRYVCDQQKWGEISPICGMRGAVDGVAGVEINIVRGDHGDPEIGLDAVDAASFFYDPRSLKEDFLDSRYMGVGKWLDLDAALEMAQEMFADDPTRLAEVERGLRDSVDAGYDLTSDPASDNKWVSIEAGAKRIRLVDHWYVKNGQWRWCLYTGSVLLDEGESYITDEMGKSVCRYIMYSANVDQDGDRYGFVRNMKSAQDEINMRRGKGLHLLNSRRLILEDGTGLNVEKTRTEAARPDGVIVYPNGTTKPEFDDAAKNAELTGQVNFLQDAKQEIENYGFNPALMGTGVDQMSGRAIQLQQQAGIAELGPYLLAFKGWKLRVYRAIWNAVRQHWTGERWIRVTDDENVAQFVAINQPMTDEFGGAVINQDGSPALMNAIGELDVDIIIDEGPDTISMQQDAYDTLSIMAQKGQQVPPELLIELSPLAGSVKKKALEIVERTRQQQAQAQQPVMQLEMAGKQAEVQETQASAKLKEAQAVKAIEEAKTVGADAAQEQETRALDRMDRMQEQQFKREDHQMKVRESIIATRGKVASTQAQIEASRQRSQQPPQAA